VPTLNSAVEPALLPDSSSGGVTPVSASARRVVVALLHDVAGRSPWGFSAGISSARTGHRSSHPRPSWSAQKS
jgi:hypothetical protein